MKQVLYIIATLVIAWYLYHLAVAIVGIVFAWLLPAAIVTGAIYVLYVTVGKKAISGGRQTLP